MANQYLKIAPTSSGNLFAFTWACWLRRWDNTDGHFVWGGNENKDDASILIWLNSGNFRWFDRQGTDSTTEQIQWDCQVRDSSAWHHVVLSFDSTRTGNAGEQRVNLYVNGTRLDRAPSSTLLNNSQNVNTPAMNQFFDSLNRKNMNNYFAALQDNSLGTYKGMQYCDCFYVDGASLRPESFGYHKTGYGTVKGASTIGRTEDVRQGFWVPKKPSIIKREIRDRGGFGANGFYLPFNSNNHPGADFHCPVNNILKIKENLPQPKAEIDGDPKFSVAHDPYGSFCQLALPMVWDGIPGTTAGYNKHGFGDYSHLIRGDGSPGNIISGPYGNLRINNNDTSAVASYYGSAAYFPDSTASDIISVSNYTNGLNIGTQDFTVEAWVFHTGGSDDTIISNETGWTFTYGVNGKLRFYMANGSNIVDATTEGFISNQWAHVVVERYNGVINFYQNGRGVGPDTSYTHNIANSNATTYIGKFHSGTVQNWDGYMQDLRVYIGVAKYKGGFDVVRPWVANNFNAGSGTNLIDDNPWRAVPDTPRNTFAILGGPRMKLVYNHSGASDASATHKNGGLTVVTTGDTGGTMATIGIHTGKYYWEVRYDDNNNAPGHGITAPGPGGGNSFSISGRGVSIEPAGDRIRTLGYHSWYDGTNNQTQDGLIVGMALDKNVGELRFFYDGVEAPGSPVTGINTFSEYHIPDIWTWNDGPQATNTFTVNFGQNPSFCGQITPGTFVDESGHGTFKYEPPAGHLALCTANMPEPAIPNPTDHFQIVLYEGDNTKARKINTRFRPDMIWFKSRNTQVSHVICDWTRGTYSHLNPNSTGAESGTSGTPYLRSFDADGFTLSDGANSGGNTSGRTYVAYCWRAGGNSANFNIDGKGYDSLDDMPIELGYTTNGITINKMSVNTKAGFSIVNYTGGPNGTSDKIPHGLGKKPAWVWQKRLSSGHWIMKHHKQPSNHVLLNAVTNDEYNAATEFTGGGIADLDGATNETYVSPLAGTSSAGNVNTNNQDCMAYIWCEVPGFSKFGIYHGDGNSDGIFVYTDFRPAFVMIKNPTTSDEWRIYDAARSPMSEANDYITMSDAAENTTSHPIEFKSNGFKCQGNADVINDPATKLYYFAFAEAPFKYGNGSL